MPVIQLKPWNATTATPNQVSFRYFKTRPKIIQFAVMLYVRFPLSLRNVEDLLHKRGVDVSYEAVRYWWHRFGFKFASEIKNFFSLLRTAFGTAFPKGHLNKVLIINNLI